MKININFAKILAKKQYLCTSEASCFLQQLKRMKIK